MKATATAALAPNVSPINYLAFLIAAFFSVASFPFVAYCLEKFVAEKFARSSEESKSILACLVAIDQVINIATGSIWGWLSDVLGRKAIFSTGLALMALSIASFPFATGIHPFSSPMGRSFALERLVFAIGASACNVMFTAVASDYSGEGSALVAAGAGFAAGLGAVFSVVGVQKISNPRVMCFSMAAAVGSAALICAAFLKNVSNRSKAEDSAMRGKRSFGGSLRCGFGRCKEFSLLISMISVFLARSNSMVSMNYVPIHAVTRAFSICSLLGTLIFGYKFSRGHHHKQELGLLISVAMVFMGYFGMATFPKVWIKSCSGAFAGIGQGGFIVCGMSLLARCAKEGEKGALSATFSLFGSLGSLSASTLGYLLGKRRQNWGMSVYIAMHSLYLLVLVAWKVKERWGKRAAESEKAHKNCIKIPL